ncbi:MAG: FAD-dependent oxidoreductase [Myxococcota bacterium]
MSTDSSHILVVGAGLAGLIAAHRIASAGIRVSVLESGPEPGGRLREGAAAIGTVPKHAPTLERIVEESGAGDDVHLLPLGRARIGARGRLAHLARAGRFGSVPGLTPLEALRARQTRGLLEWFRPRLRAQEPEGVGSLDDRSVSEFCGLYLGDTLLERVYRPLLESHFGLDADETSRVTLLFLLGPEGGPEVRLAVGLEALVARLASGLDLRVGQRVVAVQADGRGVELESGERMEADAIVLAVPAPDGQKLLSGLSPLEELFLETCRYVERRVVLLPRTRGNVSAPLAHWIPRQEGGPLAAILRVPPLPGFAGQTLLIARARSTARSDAELSDELCKAAARIEPEIAGAEGASIRTVPRFAPRFDVGRYQALARIRPEWQRRLSHRRVVLSGDYLVAPHAEGAAVAGVRAADDIVTLMSGSTGY